MKKIIALLLAIVLLISACVLNAGAVTNSKLSAPLTEALSKMSDTDKIHVWIMLGKLNMKSDSELERIAYEECGFTYGDTLSVDQKNQVRRKKLELMYNDRHQAVKELLSKMGVEYSDVVGGWNDNDSHEGWKTEFYLTKAKIMEITDIEEIATIDLCYDDYYVVGTMNDWKISQEYRLINRGEGILELFQIALSENDVFKIVKSDDGSTYSESDCYPVEGNYNDDGTLIKYDSPYYYLGFCPAGNQEGLNWHDGTIYLENLEPPEEPTEVPPSPMFRNDFEHYCYFNFYITVDHYNELYYHYTDDGELDWVLVQGLGHRERPALLYRIVGNRLLSNSSCYIPFDGTMGVYDVAKRIYFDVTDDVLNRYDGLADVYMEMGIGRLIGDIDRDDELSIIDTTIMQRCEAKSMDYPADDEVEYRNSDDQLRYYSDFNRDGERSILDATCIQRYLAGMTYPIG